MDHQDNIRPMGILLTIVYWAIPAAILYVSHYIMVPMFIQRTGQPYLVGYLIAWASTMVFFSSSPPLPLIASKGILFGLPPSPSDIDLEG